MEDLLDLKGKVALVTGAASGIGRAIAQEYGTHGANTVLVDFRADLLKDAEEEMRSQGMEVASIEADVSSADQVERACEFAARRFGSLELVAANAGINGVWAPIEELTPEEFDHTIAVNLRGTFLTIKYATPYLRKQGGAVLITSSVNGTRNFSNAGAIAYSVSKAGQLAMAKMLAVELGPYKIRVNVICPGAIQTNIDERTERRNVDSIKIPAQYPRGTSPLTGNRPGEVHQVGRLALFLSSEMADHITGEVVYIDAGSSLVVG